MTQRPLLDKSFRPVSADEDRRIRLEQMVEPPVYLERRLRSTVEERVANEEWAAAAANKPKLNEDSASYFWLTQVVNAFVAVTDARVVIRLLDMWSIAMRSELEFVERSLTYSKYQVSSVLVLRSYLC